MGVTKRSLHFCRRLAGFTLIELLVVIAIVAVLAAIAGPSFTQTIANNRVRGTTNALQAALLKARSEALKRNCPITVRRNGAWNDGWDVFATAVDCSRSAGDEYDAAPAPGLYLQRDSVKAVTVTSALDAGLVSFRYLQSGRLSGAAPVFYVRDVNARAKRRCVVIELNGMPKVVEAGKHASCPQPA